MDSGTANIPSALRHFLARGGGTGTGTTTTAQPQHLHSHHHHHHHQTNGHYNTYTSSMTTLQHQQQPPVASTQARLTPAKSASNLRSGSNNSGSGSGSGSSSTIGAWLTKYHLRPGSRAPMLSETLIPTQQQQAVVVVAAIDRAQSAYITSVESRESSASATGGGLRMGRRRFLEYQIQVTGTQTAQWRVGRRFSEFHALFQALRRQCPAQSHRWAD
ncbi:hypothetical protein GGI21_006379, partial [Coemansia aciculifera]